MTGIRIPQSFLDQPRWWHEGADWLANLPETARTVCARWRLEVTGDPVHGSNALVLPVRQDGELLVLRLTPPNTDVVEQAAALRFWAGRGTVRLTTADPSAGAMLLERLDLGGSLSALPSIEAVAILGAMMRRLAVPVPPSLPGLGHVRTTAAVVSERLATMVPEWERLGRPLPAPFLRQALDAGGKLRHCDSDLAVNGDLHSAQVLRGTREPWLTVDPVLLRGDIAFDLARVLWTRADDMPHARSIVNHFDTAVAAAGLDRDHGRDCVLFRTVDYWLWGLTAGLTVDPERCRRLMTAFTG